MPFRNYKAYSNMSSNVIVFLIIIGCLVCKGHSAFDIESYGAIPYADNLKDHITNQKAIQAAINAASQSLIDRVVRVPAKTFYTMPFKFQNINNITFLVLGRVAASKSVRYWPKSSSNNHINFIEFINCTNLQISGGGKIDGRGYHWWMLVLLNDKKLMKDSGDRPHLIHMDRCQFIKIHDIIFKNSPNYHLKMDRCHDAELYNINIKVNTTAQFNLLKKFSLEGSIIMYPYNTDGIDPSGGRMHIYNVTIQNYDDVVVPKPNQDSDCTRDMLIQNATVVLGVGMSLGSVPPHTQGNCIRNITFRNVVMKRPFKGIYIKTNPGKQGHGSITDIYYQNFSMDRPIWWAIYIGPQQMLEPDGAGPGCMIYPFDPRGNCQTQPRVTLRNITLDNIKIHKSLLYPVTIRCNVSNPCRQINFLNVQTDSWQIGQKQKGYVCEFASGRSLNNTPVIGCLNDAQQQKSQTKIQNILTTSQVLNTDKRAQIFELAHKIRSQNSQLQISFKELYHKFISLIKRQNYEWILKRIIQQVQTATIQVGYFEQNDEFSYQLQQILLQFEPQLQQPEENLQKIQ